MVILISWILWNERNRRVFDHQVRTSRQLLDFIADEAVQWVLAGYSQVEKLALALGRHTGRTFVNVIQ